MYRIRLIFFVLISTLCLLSCGKVTQELSTNEQKPTFNLSFELPNISLSSSATANVRSFTNQTPTYVVLNGYNQNESDQLAFGKIFLTPKMTSTDKTTSSNMTQHNPIYMSKSFDVKGKEILSKPTYSQILGTLNKQTSALEFQTPHVLKDYEFYIIAAYNDKPTYTFKFIDQKIVSKNKAIDIGTISDFDTFQGIITLSAFQTISFSQQTIDLIQLIFDYDFFSTFPMPYISNSMKSFSFQKPLFLFSNSMLDHYLTLLELVQLDPNDAVDFLKTLDADDMSDEKRFALIKKLQAIDLKPSSS